jgi:hypothetical protein
MSAYRVSCTSRNSHDEARNAGEIYEEFQKAYSELKITPISTLSTGTLIGSSGEKFEVSQNSNLPAESPAAYVLNPRVAEYS